MSKSIKGMGVFFQAAKKSIGYVKLLRGPEQ